LTICTTDLSVGERGTISGTGCSPGHWGTPIIDSGLNNPFIFSTTSGLYDEEEVFTDTDGDVGAQVGADGRFTMTAVVPMVVPGPSRVTRWCMPRRGPNGATEFAYPSVPVTVTTRFRMEVRPGTTLMPGATLSVTLLGGACPGPSSPTVNLYTGSQVSVTSANGSTSDVFSLTVPRGSTPGQYQLEADCTYSRGLVEGSYGPTEIIVE
jgi:hypothetical protein